MSSEYFLIVIVAYFSTYDDCIDYKIWDSKILWVCGRKGVGGEVRPKCLGEYADDS